MQTEVMESRLTRVASFLEAHAEGASVQEAVNELRTCESELVARRFARAIAADGRTIRVKVAAVDAALIHLTRALFLMDENDSHREQAIQSVEHARTEVALIAAV